MSGREEQANWEDERPPYGLAATPRWIVSVPPTTHLLNMRLEGGIVLLDQLNDVVLLALGLEVLVDGMQEVVGWVAVRGAGQAGGFKHVKGLGRHAKVDHLDAGFRVGGCRTVGESVVAARLMMVEDGVFALMCMHTNTRTCPLASRQSLSNRSKTSELG